MTENEKIIDEYVITYGASRQQEAWCEIREQLDEATKIEKLVAFIDGFSEYAGADSKHTCETIKKYIEGHL